LQLGLRDQLVAEARAEMMDHEINERPQRAQRLRQGVEIGTVFRRHCAGEAADRPVRDARNNEQPDTDNQSDE